MEFFPSIVSKSHTIDVLVNGMGGRSESLILVNPHCHCHCHCINRANSFVSFFHFDLVMFVLWV